MTASECLKKPSANHVREEVVSELHGQLAGLVCCHTRYKTATQKVPFSFSWPSEGGKELLMLLKELLLSLTTQSAKFLFS